jgi:hypothetical protein
MTKKQANSMIERINNKEGFDTARLYEKYSGRWMYGEETWGVVLPDWAVPDGCKFRQDQMGKEIILY